ncbi:transporter [Phyllobacterium salinisoli]|uniref:Transporter n=1 Tax=Phyllobacterium salinisoli TaxID=1899321 RepID=A0A368JZM4_9HYPH|nr:EamA family transporter [Phyllobacterium salinisoli]RCS21653.1 transporter [Phyllobacterium salinisoli]
MKSWHLLWIGIPVFNTLAQIFVKFAAEDANGLAATGWTWVVQAATSPWMLAAFAVEIACFFIWIKVLADFDLSRAFPLSAISYVLIVGVSWLWFREPASVLQLVGSGLILGGVWMIGTADAMPREDRQIDSGGIDSGKKQVKLR